MHVCTTPRCNTTATWVPVLEVVGMFCEFDVDQPLRAFLTQRKVCHHCMLQLNPFDLLTPQVKEMMAKSAEGGPLPDFDRARVRPLAINSPDLLEMERRAAMGRQH